MRHDGDTSPVIFLISGEPSGDALGAHLMRGLRRLTGGRVGFAGIGGERMTAEGLESLFPMAEIAVMGLVEVLPRARRIVRLVRQTADAILRLRPAAVVTIDSSGFTYRVARRVRRRDPSIRLIHYVAPQVWAWRPGKALATARLFDRLMVLLPFEPPLFERRGLTTTYVGHPVVEAGGCGDGAAFRRRHGIAAETRILGVMPGSRRTEVARLMPVFGGAVERLRTRPLHLVLPTVATVSEEVRAAAAGWPVPATVVVGDEKHDAFAACDAAIAASGTVTLELAVADVPFITAYRVNPLTALVVRRLLRTPYATMANVLLDRPLVPEFLQDDCTPRRLAMALDALLGDPALGRAQRAGFAEVRRRLAVDGAPPSERAAAVVLETITASPARCAGR